MSTLPAQPLLVPQPTGLRLSYEAFLDLGDEYTHSEWVNGEVIMMAPVTDEPDAITMFLGTLLKIFCDVRLIGRTLREPFQMKTGPDLPGRQPDLFFVAAANLQRIRERHVEGPADLVVEVISPSTRRVDRVDKFQEYESGGVSEYWLIDPHHRTAEFYQLIGGRFQERMPDDRGIYQSRALAGFWININWLSQRPLPSTVNCLREFGIL